MAAAGQRGSVLCQQGSAGVVAGGGGCASGAVHAPGKEIVARWQHEESSEDSEAALRAETEVAAGERGVGSRKAGSVAGNGG